MNDEKSVEAAGDTDADAGDTDDINTLTTQVWRTLFPIAIDQVRDALRDPDSAVPNMRWMAPALRQAYSGGTPSDDFLELKGALGSAVTEFLRWQKKNGLTNHPSEAELAYHLIRITYHRWKRRSNKDTRLSRAAALGQYVHDDGGQPLLSTLADDNLANREEFLRHFRELVDLSIGRNFSKLRRERDLAIVRMHLEGKKELDIAKQVGNHRSTVARVIKSFEDRFNKILRDEAAF